MSDNTASGGGKKSYQALGTAPELSGGLQPGKVTISGGVLRFEAAGGVVEWRLEHIQLSIGGHNNQQLFLTRTDNPKATLSTSDLSLLDEPAFQHSSLREQIVRTRKQSKTIPRGLMGCGLFLLLLLIGFIVLIIRRDQIVESLANKVPIEWEVELGQKIFQDIWMTGAEATDPVRFSKLCRDLGVDPSLLSSEEVKLSLKKNTDEAAARGVFGVPSFALDGEIFWGADSIEFLNAFLKDPTLLRSDEMQRLDRLPVGAARTR